jgi:hypothetical protein
MAESHASEAGAPLWGVSAEFETSDGMVAALLALRELGLGRLDAFSPVPIPQAGDALRLPPSPIYPFAIGGAVVGGLGMFGMCVFATISSYRFNIGGRPLFSWPAYIVPSFSSAMLVGAVAVLLVMLFLNRLPRLNHPAFNIPDFIRASSDRFFVAVEARDEAFNAERVERAFEELPTRPQRVFRVPR